MSKRCPEHIQLFAIPQKQEESPIAVEADGVHDCLFGIACSCENVSFKLFTNERRKVIAICEKCELEVLIYDRNVYPASASRHGSEEMTLFQSDNGTQVFNVFVVYSYGELDEDMEFDPNDICWCSVYALDDQAQRMLVLSDETA